MPVCGETVNARFLTEEKQELTLTTALCGVSLSTPVAVTASAVAIEPCGA